MQDIQHRCTVSVSGQRTTWDDTASVSRYDPCGKALKVFMYRKAKLSNVRETRDRQVDRTVDCLLENLEKRQALQNTLAGSYYRAESRDMEYWRRNESNLLISYLNLAWENHQSALPDWQVVTSQLKAMGTPTVNPAEVWLERWPAAGPFAHHRHSPWIAYSGWEATRSGMYTFTGFDVTTNTYFGRLHRSNDKGEGFSVVLSYKSSVDILSTGSQTQRAQTLLNAWYDTIDRRGNTERGEIRDKGTELKEWLRDHDTIDDRAQAHKDMSEWLLQDAVSNCQVGDGNTWARELRSSPSTVYGAQRRQVRQTGCLRWGEDIRSVVEHGPQDDAIKDEAQEVPVKKEEDEAEVDMDQLEPFADVKTENAEEA